jgi:P4 family phage/plasmid primase-like protien
MSSSPESAPASIAAASGEVRGETESPATAATLPAGRAGADLARDEIAERARAFQAQKDAISAALPPLPPGPRTGGGEAFEEPDTDRQRRELERTLRDSARMSFVLKREDPVSVLAWIRFSNAHYTYALDPADLPNLVYGELQRARKTRLPVSRLTKHENHYTEVGLAERFVVQHWESVLYCAGMKAWLVWNGRVWERDTAGVVRTKARLTARRVYAEISRIEDDATRRSLLGFAQKAESARRIRAMLELAESEVPISVADLDADMDLFNVRNGTIELSTGAFREHRPEDYLTKLADVDFVAGAGCPTWEAHLARIFGGDAEAIAGFQSMCGYSLLADNPAEVFFILYGTGANGKSKTLEVLSAIWGDYAQNVDASRTLLARRHNDGPRTELAALVGARLVTTSEGAEGARLDEAVVKQLTGRDPITVRKLYQEEFTYRPGYTIWFATNHRPPVSTDPAMWRRIWLVPFAVTIPPGDRDEAIAEKMLAERSGILNWCLAGLARYREAGRLAQPDVFAVATEEYRLDADVAARFVDEECVVTGVPDDREVRSDLYAGFLSWAKDNGVAPVSAKKFAEHLRSRGVTPDPGRARVINSRGEAEFVRFWRGIRFKDNDEANPEVFGR